MRILFRCSRRLSIHIVGHRIDREFLWCVTADTDWARSTEINGLCFVVRGTCTISLHSPVKYLPHKNTNGSKSDQIDFTGIRNQLTRRVKRRNGDNSCRRDFRRSLSPSYKAVKSGDITAEYSQTMNVKVT